MKCVLAVSLALILFILKRIPSTYDQQPNMVFGKTSKTTVTLPKSSSGSTQWDPAKAFKTTKVTKYVGAMDPTDEEGDDKDPSSDEEPSFKGKGGFGSSTSRAKTTTTKVPRRWKAPYHPPPRPWGPSHPHIW